MTTTRPNDTPPCGSGRKYKKCWELATRRSSAAVMLAVGGAIPAAIFIGVALCVLALADQRHTAFAQGAAPPDVVRAIDAFESRFNAALAQRDRTTLERLIATPFTWVHGSDGRVDSRDVWLSNASQGYALSGQRDTRSEHGATLVVYGEPTPSTAVRVARVRLRDASGARESWLRQTHVLVRDSDGVWRMAQGQGTLMYDGPPLDASLHARYAGTYVIAPGRVLTLTWEDEALLATFPNGAKSQIFLASPTEEAVRAIGAGQLRFTLGPDGRPTAAALVRGTQEVWRAARTER